MPKEVVGPVSAPFGNSHEGVTSLEKRSLDRAEDHETAAVADVVKLELEARGRLLDAVKGENDVAVLV